MWEAGSGLYIIYAGSFLMATYDIDVVLLYIGKFSFVKFLCDTVSCCRGLGLPTKLF